jgi:AAHS family 4-hydroxybenzoate transporter-like MFS transporter
MFLISGILTTILLALMTTVEALSAAPDPGEQQLVITLVGAAGAFFSAGIAGLYVLMTHSYPQSCRSAGIGFGIFMSRIGAVGASAFGGALLTLGGESTVPFFAVLIFGALLISVGAIVVDRHVPSLAFTRRASTV